VGWFIIVIYILVWRKLKIEKFELQSILFKGAYSIMAPGLIKVKQAGILVVYYS